MFILFLHSFFVFCLCCCGPDTPDSRHVSGKRAKSTNSGTTSKRTISKAKSTGLNGAKDKTESKLQGK